MLGGAAEKSSHGDGKLLLETDGKEILVSVM